MEEKIITLLRHQNQEAVALLYDHYGAALFGIILRVVRSRDLAEQVLQDAFVKVWKNGAAYDNSKGRLFTWILNIARNAAIDATRTAHYKFYQKTDDLDAVYGQADNNSPNPDTIGLRQMVQQLDEKYRILIEKIYFEGYTHLEIEQELGIPAGTVKTRLRYAMQELRKKFADGPTGELAVLLLFLQHYLGKL